MISFDSFRRKLHGMSAVDENYRAMSNDRIIAVVSKTVIARIKVKDNAEEIRNYNIDIVIK